MSDIDWSWQGSNFRTILKKAMETQDELRPVSEEALDLKYQVETVDRILGRDNS